MRVENYRCSEDQIEEMAGNHYWFFMRGMPSSGRPTSTMDPYRSSVFSDQDGSRSSDMSSRSDMSDRSSDMPSSSDMSDRPFDMSSSFDRSDRSSDLYSSSSRSDRPSNTYRSVDNPMDSSYLHGSSSDDYFQSSRPPHGDHSSYSDMPGGEYRSSLPYICRGKLKFNSQDVSFSQTFFRCRTGL